MKEFEEIARTDILKHLDLPSFHHSCRVELHCLHAGTKAIHLLRLFQHHLRGGELSDLVFSIYMHMVAKYWQGSVNCKLLQLNG